MSNEPFFSVVIPVYNSEKYLNDCISSVFSQTWPDFELVLVDDGSSDKSPQICDDWMNRYPDKVRVIRQENAGVYIAKRNGIKAAKGQYIYVIDNDDLIINNNALAEIKDKILKTDSDLVIFNAVNDLKTGHYLCHIPFDDGRIFVGEDLKIIYDHYLDTKDLHHIWMMIFKRDLFDLDYEYKESFRMLRDGPCLTLPVISNAKKILYLKEAYYYWRVQNRESASKHYDVLSFFYSVRALHNRVLEVSKSWKYKSDKTDALINKNYVTDVCIAAIKVRGQAKDAKISRKKCLAIMANDKEFRKLYSLKQLEGFRKPVAFFLYHKQYRIVSMLSSLIGLIKD